MLDIEDRETSAKTNNIHRSTKAAEQTTETLPSSLFDDHSGIDDSIR